MLWSTPAKMQESQSLKLLSLFSVMNENAKAMF